MKEITLNGVRYTSQPWNATKKIKMKFRLGNMLRPALNAFVQAKNNSNSVAVLVSSAVNVLAEITPEEAIDIVTEISCSAIRDGERMNTAQFDMYFAEDFTDAYRVAFMVIEEQYGSLLKVLGINSSILEGIDADETDETEEDK